MKRVLLYIFAYFITSGILYAQVSVIADNYKEDITSLIVKDIKNKQILYSKASNQQMRPASLTKIMTAILAIESGKMNKVVTITKESTKAAPTKAGLKVGDKIYLKDLVKSTLISSANDSATAIGIYIGGSSKRFAAMMNRKARKLGMKNTRFTNAAGFDIGNHYSTAKDLLILAEYAIKNKIFNQIVKLDYHAFSPINNKRRYISRTSNRLLKEHKYAIGVKTGYTSKAGPCLIARAKKGDKDIILVMLNSKYKRWESATNILNVALGIDNQQIAQTDQEDNMFLKQGKYVTPY